MERKLATIRKVSDIQPIENADNIDVATVDGWKVVVKKGEFEKGDLGVFFEIDSFLPIEERYEFLRKSCYKTMADGTEGFRLKTVKLRKQLSQGLLLPLNLFPEIEPSLGGDVTEQLSVKKYEPPIPACLSGIVKRGFPSFIRKTDQERIQNLPEYFDTLAEMEFEESEKLDGSSATYYYNDSEFGVCSRNLELKENETNTLWQVAKKIEIEESLENLNMNIAVQGELVGESINRNTLKLMGQHFYIFDIFDIDKHRYLTPNERYELIERLSNDKLKQVPILNIAKIFTICPSMEKMLDYADEKSALNPKVSREGVVFKSCQLWEGDIVSFKVINNNYLLKHE